MKMKIFKIFTAIFLFWSFWANAQERLDVDLGSTRQEFLAYEKEINYLQSKLDKEILYRQNIFKNIESEFFEWKKILENKNSSKEDLKIAYQDILHSWRLLSGYSFDFFNDKNLFKLEKSEPKISSKIDNQNVLNSLNDLRRKISKKKEKLLDSKKDFVEINQNQQSKMLLNLGYLRSLAIERGVANESYEQYLNDLAIELKLIKYQPLLFFYSKILDYKILIKEGISGFIKIFKQIFLLIFVGFVLLMAKKILAKFGSLIKNLRKVIFDDEDHIFKKTKINNIFYALNPYIEWIGLIILFSILSNLVNDDFLGEVSAIFPYFIYYFIYKIFRIFSSNYLIKLIYRPSEINSKIFSKTVKIRKTSKVFGIYLLICAWFLHFSKSIVLKALIYNLVFDLCVFGFVILAFFQISKWSEEISKDAKSIISQKYLNLFLSKKLSVIFSLPILTLLILNKYFRLLCGLCLKNDFIKSIFVHFYSKKLESAAKSQDSEQEQNKSEQVPQKYCDLFELDKKFSVENFIEVKSHPAGKILQVINSWICGQSCGNSLMINGESGIGKSHFLKWVDYKIVESHKKKVNIVSIDFSQKILSANSLYKELSSSIGFSAKSSFEKEIAKIEDKTIIILDDCHNLFLAKEGGFDAILALLELINLNKNIFIIASFSRYSWNFLKNAVNAEQYFHHQFRLPRWQDVDIKKLIMKKHEESELELIYDSSIFDINSITSKKEFEAIQQRFFQIIWSRSKGNPRSAISLWLMSLRNIGAKTLKITLPKSTKFSNLVDLSESHFFVYALITRHQNLSLDEICEISQIKRSAVVSIINLALENGYLEEVCDKKYRISGQWQITITKALINKNFIYE